MSPSSEVLFSSDLWQPALEKYARAAHLTVKLFDHELRAIGGPIHPSPLFRLFDETGYDPGIFAECVRRCLVQTQDRPAVIVSQFHGLAVVGTSLVLDGKIVGAAVGGYVLADFSQVSEIQSLARQAGIAFDRIWEVARQQQPVPQNRLIVHGELLQVLGDALLRENYRTRQYAETAAIVAFSDDAIIGKTLMTLSRVGIEAQNEYSGTRRAKRLVNPSRC
jgi:Sensory domain found in PocR